MPEKNKGRYNVPTLPPPPLNSARVQARVEGRHATSSGQIRFQWSRPANGDLFLDNHCGILRGAQSQNYEPKGNAAKLGKPLYPEKYLNIKHNFFFIGAYGAGETVQGTAFVLSTLLVQIKEIIGG